MATALNPGPQKRGRKPKTGTATKTLRDQLKDDFLALGYFTESNAEETNKVRSWLDIRRPGIGTVPAFDGAKVNTMTIRMVFNYEGTRVLGLEATQETYEVTSCEQHKVFC